MPLDVKICGIGDAAALDAAVRTGARLVGFVFFARSPRALTLPAAAALAGSVPAGVLRVGLVVDAADDEIARICAAVPLDLLQLHGAESPGRVAEVRARFRLPVIKAIGVAHAGDLAPADAYAAVADWLLFDARPPADATRPGGNAQAIDWRLLAGRSWPVPWLLAGGLHAGNLAEAVRLSGAAAVDVSSGVEDAPGHKSAALIRAFLAEAARIAALAATPAVAPGTGAAYM
ncbi:MAG TPA: phosphoribosylanthranilate isomerase [Rhodospirillales bacterium]|nr:phosphoribosylanthranilate isomerase [Rhodospirillales bacterium]